MKKAQASIVILIVLVVIVILILGVLVYLFYNRGIIPHIPQTCDYSDSSKAYVNTDSNCAVNFLCIQGSQSFKDNCGCGCQKIITQTVTCNSNFDCGGVSQTNICSGNNLYNHQIINICINSGTIQSSCSSSTNDILIQNCNNGCQNNQCINQGCDYNSRTKTYVNKNTNCIINFFCTANRRAFHDECGCGCEIINTPTPEPTGKVYCTQQQRNPGACYQIYSPVCGWFNQNINCLRYPCAQTFSNSCFACMDSKVDYYTIGECPA